MRTDDAAADPRNAGVLAFLRYKMTAEEQARPAAGPVFRSPRDVSIHALRVHPDLSERLASLSDERDDHRMLMGAAVLVSSGGAIYALAYSQSFLAIRLPDGVDPELVARVRQSEAAPGDASARGRQQVERVSLLGTEWVVVEPWLGSVGIDLAAMVALARTAAR